MSTPSYVPIKTSFDILNHDPYRTICDIIPSKTLEITVKSIPIKMATVDACVQKQKKEFVLQAPVSSSSTHAPESTTLTGTTMSVALVNNTSSSTVYAYISGLASDNNSAVFMLER